MTEPIVFVSHFVIRAGQREAYLRLQREIAAAIEAGKPRTVVFLAHLGGTGSEATITHVFPDAAAMDDHFAGSDARSRAADEVMIPAGWEIYGSPSGPALDTIRQAAASSGVSLTVAPDFVAGYIRSPSA